MFDWCLAKVAHPGSVESFARDSQVKCIDWKLPIHLLNSIHFNSSSSTSSSLPKPGATELDSLVKEIQWETSCDGTTSPTFLFPLLQFQICEAEHGIPEFPRLNL